MTTKRCFYKGCDSVQTPDIPCAETFFQFPKDETRYELWMELSRCEDKNTKGIKYLCSKHFDHSKYMSTNPRRKLLLATAVPYPYQSDNEDNAEVEEERLQDVVSSQYEDEEYFTVRDGLEDIPTEHVVERDDQDDIVIGYPESTDNAQVEIVEQSDYDKSLAHHSKSTLKKINICRKRKMHENDSSDGSNFKIFQIRTLNQSKRLIKREAVPKVTSNESNVTKSTIEFSEEDLIADPNVTTFIFKNEEYVQMPKKIYVNDKLELLRELQYYKDIITNFKNLIDNVKL